MSGPVPSWVTTTTTTYDKAAAVRPRGESVSTGGSFSAAGNYAMAQALERPRALDESFSPDALSDEELLLELARLQKWLDSYAASSTERVRAEAILLAVRTQVAKRSAREYARPLGPLLAAAGGLNADVAMAAAGFTSGFLQGATLYAAEHPERVPFMTRLQDQLGQPLNSGAFNLGALIGVHKGVILGFVDNVVGLVEMAGVLLRYGTPLGWAYGSIKQGIDMVRDPAAWMARQAAEARTLREVVSALYRFSGGIAERSGRLDGHRRAPGHTGWYWGCRMAGAGFHDSFASGQRYQGRRSRRPCPHRDCSAIRGARVFLGERRIGSRKGGDDESARGTDFPATAPRAGACACAQALAGTPPHGGSE